jgi:hypothetical protein
MVVGSVQRVSPGSPVPGQQGSPGPPQPLHLPAWHIPKGWPPAAVQACPAPTQPPCTQQPPPSHLAAPGQQGSPGPPHFRQVSLPQTRPLPHLPIAQQGSPGPPHLLQVVPAQRRSAP